MKRVIGLILILSILLSLFSGLSFNSFADDLPSSGSCGTDVYYTFDSSTGLLTISGRGGINVYSFEYQNSIKTVVINSGVTSIGSWAFYYCSKITSITIPASVTSIAAYAFRYCSSLTNITIPDSVTSIGSYAFSGCSGLKSISIPVSVTSISTYTFDNCNNIKDIYYSGSREQWNRIQIATGNDCLNLATIHFPPPPHYHSYRAVVTAPKANAVGYTQYKCDCGEFKKDASGKVIKDKFTSPTGKPSGLKCASRKATSEKFTWTKASGVSGYQLQISAKGGKTWAKTYNAKTATVYTIKSLTAGSEYKVRVRFYITKNAKNYYGAWATLTSPTLPSGTTISKLTAKKKAFTAQWKNNSTVNGYEIQYSKNSKFKDAKSLKYKRAIKLTIKSKKGGKKYFIRVRTYKTIAGKIYYSEWSKAKSVTTKK